MTTAASKTLAQMAAEVDEYCQVMGWREDPVTFGEAMALLHEEIAEAGSAWRKNGLDDMTQVYDAEGDGLPKPEGVGSEFADIFIRLLDDSVIFGVDLEAALTRHRGRYAVNESFLENMDTLHIMVARASEMRSLTEYDYRSQFAAVYVFLTQLCGMYGIDLAAEYERKMEYNRSRPYRHGNKRK